MIPFILKLIAKACALCVVLPLDIYDLLKRKLPWT